MAFRLILFAILAYLIISYFRRFMNQPDEDSRYDNTRRESKKREGSVSVENTGDRKKTINKEEGDYIDYEEVK